MAVQTHNVEREKGDASRSQADELYEEASYQHDERANTETTFWLSDIENLQTSERRKRRLRKALRRQEGENQGEPYQADRRMRRDANRDEWKRRVTCMYTARFDMTPHQKRRARHLVNILDFSSFGSYTKEQCILGVVNTVAREDGRFIENEEDFKQASMNEGLSMKGLRNIRCLVRDRL